MTFDRLNQNWQQMKEQPTIWLTINDDLTVAKDKSECTNDIDSQLHHGLTDKWPVTLTNQVNTALRWLNTVLAVCEYTSFAKSGQEKGCNSQAETWQVKNLLMKNLDWQVKCDVFVISMATWTLEYNLNISILLSLHKIRPLDFPINLHTAYYN